VKAGLSPTLFTFHLLPFNFLSFYFSVFFREFRGHKVFMYYFLLFTFHFF